MRTILSKLKSFGKFLILAHLGRILLGAILTVIGGSLSHNGIIGELIHEGHDCEHFDIWVVIMILGIGLWLGESFVLLYNTIKAKLNKK